MLDWTQIVSAVRNELEVTGEGPQWIAGRLPGSPRVIKLRERQVNGSPWVQVLVAVMPAKSAKLFAVLQDSALRMVGAPAIDERTLVVREGLSMAAASWQGIKQLATVLHHEAERMAAQHLAPPAETSELATNFAE